jgi:tetratricopeptide (TPR) repeat protein
VNVKIESPAAPGISDPDFALLQLQSQLENDEGADRIGSLRTIGKILMQKRRYEEAIPVYEALLAVDATSVQTQQTLARCLERLGRWGEAVARYQLVLEADPVRADALVGMGLCMLRQNTPVTALAAFDRCLKDHPSHLGALLGKATCLRLIGKADEADAINREAVRVHPEIESAIDELMGGEAEPPVIGTRVADSDIAELENIIAAAVSAEDYGTAAEHCRTLAEITPDYYEAWFDLGVFEQSNSNLEAAADAFRRAAHLRPSSVEPIQAVAQLYHRGGDMKAAAAAYEQALALAPDSSALLWNLGLVLEQQGDFAGAAQKYSRLVKSDQDGGEAWFHLGFARLQFHDYEGSVVAFRRALDLGARTFESNYNLGLACWELGRVSQASECFRTALRQQPDFRPAHRGLAAVALGQGDYTRARDLHRQLVEGGDTSVEILFNLAVFEHRDNRLHSAIELYKQALRVDPDLEDASAGLALAQSTLSTRRYK